jgi:hypothetical protein
MDERNILVAMRTEDFARRHTVTSKWAKEQRTVLCEGCGEACTISPASQALMARESVKVLCEHYIASELISNPPAESIEVALAPGGAEEVCDYIRENMPDLAREMGL